MNRVARMTLVLGIAACLFVWFMPWFRVDMPAFVVHMIRHMTLVAVAAPLLVLGVPAICRCLPAMPLLASFVEFIVVWGWHLPAAHSLTHGAGVWLIAEQISFLFVGVLLWASALDSDRALAGAGALLLTSMHMTLLGALIILSPRPLYPLSLSTVATLPATASAALAAQQLGGMVMLLIGTPVYLLAGLWRIHDVLAMGNTTVEADHNRAARRTSSHQSHETS